MSAARALGCGVVLAGVATAGCEAVLDFDFDAVEPIPAARCVPAHPNPPSAVTDAGGELEVTAVVMNAEYGDGLDASGTPRFLTQGYDLDGLCTGARGPSACTPPAWVGVDESDGTNGRDNGVGRMFESQDELFGLTLVTSDFLAAHVNDGTTAPNGVIRVRGYNGFHEDDNVVVDWFVPVAPALLENGAFTPAFDGSDVWPLDEGALDGTTADGAPQSAYRDANAYVAGYQLVAHFPRLLIPLANVYFEAHDVVVTSEIVSTASATPRLQKGTLAGVIPAAKFLEVISLTTAAVTGQELCKNSVLYPDIKHFICVSADSPLDRTSGGECDGSAFGITFDTAKVTLGEPAPSPALPNPCGDEPDTCSHPAGE